MVLCVGSEGLAVVVRYGWVLFWTVDGLGRAVLGVYVMRWMVLLGEKWFVWLFVPVSCFEYRIPSMASQGRRSRINVWAIQVQCTVPRI
jgi:hypothetical protein